VAVGTQGEASRSRAFPEGHFANHFEVAFTNYEFLLDFGQAYDPADCALIHTRIILSPRNAIVFSRMLADLVEQYKQRNSDPTQEQD
jgi:hypothetical protein